MLLFMVSLIGIIIRSVNRHEAGKPIAVFDRTGKSLIAAVIFGFVIITSQLELNLL